MKEIFLLGFEIFLVPMEKNNIIIEGNKKRRSAKRNAVIILFVFPYLQMISQGTFKILATFKMVSMCLPVAAAMWWVGPDSLQRLQNSRAPIEKRVRMLVSPKVKMGPSSFTPSATTNLKLPSPSCVIAR